MSAKQRCFALFVNLLGAHANLGDLWIVSRGGRGEHGVGTGFAVLGVSRGGRGEHGVGTGFAVLGVSRESMGSLDSLTQNPQNSQSCTSLCSCVPSGW